MKNENNIQHLFCWEPLEAACTGRVALLLLNVSVVLVFIYYLVGYLLGLRTL